MTSEGSVQKGGNLTLRCIVEELGVPLSKEYLWIHEKGDYRLQVNSSVYQISNMTIEDESNYTCSALNEVGSGPEGKTEVHVNGK